ncbi:AI-2E family transporter [Tepidamorphus sp. 3E244]|uniref:AI-2E family transporter n=1 Tax=Tepidamorphus sp. 3E244 TaxID=3385498 RepID=UPI0038FD280D
MTFSQQMKFWLLALVALLAMLWLFSGILLPFVAGMALAYLLDPLADRLEKYMPRFVASLLILVVFTLLFVSTLLALVPVLASQFDGFIMRFPEYAQRMRELVDQWSSTSWIGRFLQDSTQELEGNIGSVLQNVGAWVGTFLKSLLTGGMAVINTIALFVVTPVVAFYMLVDWDRMIEKVDGLLPRDHKKEIRRIMSDVDDAMAGFIRGQTFVCMILGAFYAIGLTLIGLNFGLLIGLGAGLISFIPYVGSLSGFIVAVGVALVQFWPDWPWIAATAGIFMAGQAIEGNILQPKLVGEHVGLHPVWLMFALFAFGYLFGFVGMLLAVPMAAALGVVARFAVEKYRESTLYRGTDDKAPDNLNG